MTFSCTLRQAVWAAHTTTLDFARVLFNAQDQRGLALGVELYDNPGIEDAYLERTFAADQVIQIDNFGVAQAVDDAGKSARLSFGMRRALTLDDVLRDAQEDVSDAGNATPPGLLVVR